MQAFNRLVLKRVWSVLIAIGSAFGFFLNPAFSCQSGFAQVLEASGQTQYPCQNVELLARVDLAKSGVESQEGNDIWGWTDSETGREYVLMGLDNKTAFVDITDPKNPVHVADLLTHSVGSIWRDIKVYKNAAYIVSEAPGHGIQIYDLTGLRGLDPKTMPVKVQETSSYPYFETAHNIAIDEVSGYGYAVGTNTCDSGVHVVDLRDPLNPQFVNCLGRDIFESTEVVSTPKPHGSFLLPHFGASFLMSASMKSGGDAYTHDIQCVTYHGPDLDYTGREICVASNDDTFNIVDVTDKANPIQISVMKYEGWAFAHQGWLTEDHSYFLLGDEVDELKNKVKTTTYLFSLRDLDNPTYIGTHVFGTDAIDHNLYVSGNYVYESNYTSGLRILDLKDIAQGKLQEVGYFDVWPSDDKATFNGTWSVYPYFKSGVIAVSEIDHGQLFLLKKTF